MSTGTELDSEHDAKSASSSRPRVSACRSCPEKVVFIESSNTDGWIATDVTVTVDR